MKVLHLIPTYLPAKIALGPIYPTHYLNKRLVEKGIDVTVYTTNLDERKVMDVPLNQPVFIDGVRVFYFPASFPSRWFYSRELRKALTKNLSGFDIVHITSVFLAFSALGAHYAKKFGKPYIISPHGSLMKEPLAMKGRLKKKLYIDFIEKRNLNDAAAVHFTVTAEREEYLALGFPLKKSFVIPNGFHSGEFEKRPVPGFFRSKFNISADKKIILFLGRINWKKGLDTLIPALRKIADRAPNTVLVVAGIDNEGYKKQVEAWIKEFHLEGNVIFPGALFGEEKIGAFQDAQVFVLPSYSENFGITVLEAMHLGLPVVITKYVGLARDMEKAEAGLVIEKGEDELANAVLSILNDPALSKTLSDRGKKFVQDEFSLDRVADRMLAEYRKLMEN